MIEPSLQKELIVAQHFCKNILPQMLGRVLDAPLNSRAELILLQIKYLQLQLHRFCYMQRRIYGCCNIQDGALCDIVNGWKTLAIITKHSILDVAAALDPPLICFFEGTVRKQNKFLQSASEHAKCFLVCMFSTLFVCPYYDRW